MLCWVDVKSEQVNLGSCDLAERPLFALSNGCTSRPADVTSAWRLAGADPLTALKASTIVLNRKPVEVPEEEGHVGELR